MIRRLFLLACVLAGAVSATAQPEANWLRYPSISPDGKTIAFTYKGDLYRVPAGGGASVALTSHPAHDFMPVWSHDGRRIALPATATGTSISS